MITVNEYYFLCLDESGFKKGGLFIFKNFGEINWWYDKSDAVQVADDLVCVTLIAVSN